MSRAERERLADIRDAIRVIHTHRTQATTSRDTEMLHDALLFQFVVIGEAVKNLQPETRDRSPEIPWADVAGLRDLIAHEYFRIDIEQVLAIVDHDLPRLEEVVERLLLP